MHRQCLVRTNLGRHSGDGTGDVSGRSEEAVSNQLSSF